MVLLDIEDLVISKNNEDSKHTCIWSSTIVQLDHMVWVWPPEESGEVEKEMKKEERVLELN